MANFNVEKINSGYRQAAERDRPALQRLIGVDAIMLSMRITTTVARAAFPGPSLSS